MLLIDARIHSEHVQVITCDIKPGSATRSIDVDKTVNVSGAFSRGSVLNARLPIKIDIFFLAFGD
jgi:hypothetical protein